tara:strand:+ start:493 stop:1233 length:741 start_codon:yes stop_codon:yes gene_type:complete
MKILMLDIETSPHKAYCWGLFDQRIGLNQIVEPGSTMCWAARWYGAPEGEFAFGAEWEDKDFIGQIWDMLDEADAVIHYNGKKFDMPTLNWEFIQQGGTPPAPYKEIDLLQTVRQKFRPASRKLDYVAQELGIGEKIKHAGMDLWRGCMEGDKDSQEQMKAYNIQDVFLLEELYERLLPWIGNHPNRQLYSGDRDTCPSCGGSHIEYRGYSYSNAGKFRRFRCNDCGSWSKSPKSVDTSNLRGGNI